MLSGNSKYLMPRICENQCFYLFWIRNSVKFNAMLDGVFILRNSLNALFEFLYIYLYYCQVAVFSPSRSAHYLNITLSNVVKVHVLSAIYNEPRHYGYLQ